MSERPVHSPRTPRHLATAAVCAAIAISTATLCLATPASAAQPPVGLGTADSFAVLAGSTVTNVGPSTISGDVGVSPGAAITGLTSDMVTGGTIHDNDASAASAQSDLTTAYNSAAGRNPATSVPADLGGKTLVAGVYGGPTLGLTGALTLDAQGDPSAVFVFQSTSTLITASSSSVVLTNGADACNVFWQVGSSATLGTDTAFVGSVLALTSITATTGASIHGRLLARNGAVTLDDNDITRSGCATSPTGSSSSSTPSDSDTHAAATSAPPASSVGAGPAAPVVSSSTTAGGPGIGSVSPTTGPAAGGTAVTVTGSGFVSGGTTVSLGSMTVPAAEVHVLTVKKLSFLTPAHGASTAAVKLTTRFGSTSRQGLTFTYVSTTSLTTTTLSETGTPDIALAVVGAGLIALGGLSLQIARKPIRGRHQLR